MRIATLKDILWYVGDVLPEIKSNANTVVVLKITNFSEIHYAIACVVFLFSSQHLIYEILSGLAYRSLDRALASWAQYP